MPHADLIPHAVPHAVPHADLASHADLAPHAVCPMLTFAPRLCCRLRTCTNNWCTVRRMWSTDSRSLRLMFGRTFLLARASSIRCWLQQATSVVDCLCACPCHYATTITMTRCTLVWQLQMYRWTVWLLSQAIMNFLFKWHLKWWKIPQLLTFQKKHCWRSLQLCFEEFVSCVQWMPVLVHDGRSLCAVKHILSLRAGISVVICGSPKPCYLVWVTRFYVTDEMRTKVLCLPALNTSCGICIFMTEFISEYDL